MTAVGERWPSAATTVVGVIGEPLAHSLSPLLHNTAFRALALDWVSVGFPVVRGQAGAAVQAMRALRIAGLSVTMPHKSEVVAHVDELDQVAQRLGAVNCCTLRSGRVVGSNTDGQGFLAALARGAKFDPAGRDGAILGGGGAARAVALALRHAGARSVVVVNRDPARAAATAAMAAPVGRVGAPDEAVAAELVVNATPVGMAGSDAEGGRPLVPGERLGPGQVVVDLVYHPRATPWLQAAADTGATTLDGLGMLVHQAALQLEGWTGQPAPVEAMWRAADADLG
jgi:shikimate dehydrogenase